MSGLIEKHKNLLIVFAVIIVVSIVFVPKLFNNDEEVKDNFVPIEESRVEVPSTNIESSKQDKQEPITIYADIKGEVKKPGVYEFKQGERVKDAVAKAGGFTENADVKQVNLAIKVTDEMIIYIPKTGEKLSSAVIPNQTNTVTAGSNTDQGKINLNLASPEEFTDLPGIGPAKAEAIVEYRETNGQFKTIDELKEISGIGDKTFEKLKNLITVQ